MYRFYCPNNDFSSKQTFIDDKEELHHLRNVLRLKKDSEVQLFNGKDAEAAGILLSVSKGQATVQINSVKTIEPKNPKIILACALPKKSKFELIVEKATELGVDEIIPLKTLRTEVKLADTRLDKKQSRFQTIAVSAAKQSQRALVPIIHPVTNFSSALQLLSDKTTPIIPSLTDNTKNILSVLQKIDRSKSISFFIGPEGDFTNEEYAEAREKGCIPVTLGSTILRVETAAICTLSCANLFFHA